MDKVTCEKCGKEFKSAHALKIHDAIAHSVKAPKASKPAKKAKKAKKSAKKSDAAAFVCETCGKEFKTDLAVKIHVGKQHGKKAKRAAKKAKGASTAIAAPVAAAKVGIDVQTLTVDQLLMFKQQIDARLTDIVRQMKAAKVPL